MSGSNSEPRRWIISAKGDALMFGVPMAAAALSLLPIAAFQSRELSFPMFLIAVVAFDVSHVWATIYRVYLDPVERKRRPLLYYGSIPLLGLLAFRLHQHSSSTFWTVLAYVAIFHFIKQIYGFVSLYRVRAGERSPVDYHLDKWTVWLGALAPVLAWHAAPQRQFDWFNAGEHFVAHVPPSLVHDLWVVYGVTAVAYIARQVQVFVISKHFNWGKNLLMVASWVSWYVGIRASSSPFVSAAFLNLLHGIPFIVLVWVYQHRKWHKRKPSDRARTPAIVWLTARAHVVAFLGLVVVIAMVEEGLWDSLVWKRFVPQAILEQVPTLSPTVLSLIVAVLSLPQILHYFLDAFIWRFDASNPDLRPILLEWVES